MQYYRVEIQLMLRECPSPRKAIEAFCQFSSIPNTWSTLSTRSYLGGGLLVQTSPNECFAIIKA